MKRIINVVITLTILYVVLAFLGPKHLHLERSIRIARPTEQVKEELNDFKNFHAHWSPFTEKDTAMKVEYIGTAGTAGSKYVWSGNSDVDEGSIEFIGWSGDSLKEKIVFGEHGDADLSFVVKADSGSTKVTWGIDINIAFIRRPFMLFIPMDKILAEDFKNGLAKLKTTVESKSIPSTYTIEKQTMPALNYIGIKETVMFADMANFYGRAYGELFSDKSIKGQSAPSSIFISYDGTAGKAEIVACVAIDKKMQNTKFTQLSYPASTAYIINYYGPYEKVGPAHDQLSRYVSENKLSTLAVIEEYITDPKLEPDSSKWLTKIYYLCK